MLARNDDYWGEKPKLDALETRVVPEDSARCCCCSAARPT
jgi:ABC-type transport system substrate-binding protein